MSQISSVSSYEEPETGESDHTTSSLSRCNSSSSSILTTAVQTEPNKEALTSSGTGWTDSKHSSYLNFMEATFVKNMYGSGYCAEDVCGKSSCHRHQYVDVEEYDDDSAQSQLHIPFETMEFKVCDRGDWTWRPASGSMAPAGIPLVLLTNPWVKHFRSKNMSSIPSTCIPSRKDEVISVTQNVEHPQRVGTYEITFSSNPVDVGVSKTKKRAAWSTDKQLPVTRQKIDSKFESGAIGTDDQEGASSHMSSYKA